MAKVEIEDTELAELRKAAAVAAKQTVLAEALNGQLAEARKGEARLKELEGQVAQHQAERLDATFKGAGITDPKVRKLFTLEFEEQSATEKGEKDLGKWLDGMKAAKPEERPAILAPFLAPAGAAAPTRSTVTAPKSETGTVGGATPDGSAITAEHIAAMTPDQFRAALPTLSKLDPQIAQMASSLGAKTEGGGATTS